MRFYGLVIARVTELVVTVLAFLFLGRYMDRSLNSGSRYVTIGTITGLIIGMVRITISLKGYMDQKGDPDQP